MNNSTILFYVIKILIILAQTSDMPPYMKQIRVGKLTDILIKCFRHEECRITLEEQQYLANDDLVVKEAMNEMR